ncbi:MAG: type II toxin-antitoxin system VapC family toxin [Verrucomicrobiota bacterium]
MTVYLDSSVLVRRLRKETAPLPTWGTWDVAYASVLARVEIFRFIDRTRLHRRIDDDEVSQMIRDAQGLLDGIALVPLHGAILNRASQSFLTRLGTLDALHLATALWLVDNVGTISTFLTHDAQLALAARSVSLMVEGA